VISTSYEAPHKTCNTEKLFNLFEMFRLSIHEENAVYVRSVMYVCHSAFAFAFKTSEVKLREDPKQFQAAVFGQIHLIFYNRCLQSSFWNNSLIHWDSSSLVDEKI
jgi:hypothetical protein